MCVWSLGNYYSIKNDYDQPARLFFAQGCEVAVRADGEAITDGGADVTMNEGSFLRDVSVSEAG